MACGVTLPRNLKWVDVSHSGTTVHILPQIAFLKNSTLKFFNGSYTGIHAIAKLVYCVWNIVPQIETIDGSNNNVECINSDVFNESLTHCNWDSLQVLNLSSNRLGQEINRCKYNRNNSLRFLRPLRNLKVLQLAANMLSGNTLGDLQNLVNLELLNLSSNGLHTFSLKLNNMTKLTRLDLEDNNLKCFSRSTIMQLNNLQNLKKNGTYITVDLSKNIFSCNCECFSFFQWMKTTNVKFINKGNYQCEFEDGRKETLNRISSITSQLEIHCYGNTWLKVSIILEILVWVIISLGSVSYRRRHDIKYIFLKLKMNRQKLQRFFDQRNYTYTAFVCCDYRDAKYFVKKKTTSQFGN